MKIITLMKQEMEISLKIPDTNFDHPRMYKIAITYTKAFLLVFSVNNVSSFKQMSDVWSQIVQQRKNARTLSTVIVEVYKTTKTAILRDFANKKAQSKSVNAGRLANLVIAVNRFQSIRSLLRRTKHLSLRMKYHDKEIILNVPDESDCKIS
ncbi:hypothetical protein X798_04551 [Onchocerca flexuosa]|uniref:Uncharacterized protein n=1 Tax=Onchocerca flexuosa TaxID=387005 RepID=A0A238BSM5_9BILA|nr:hypothetical protein X798_04551 [Onchocerca flexuosa]